MLKSFIKFSFVGIIGTVINLAVLYLFTDVFGIYYIFSAVFAFFFAVTSNFILNDCWTFDKNKSGSFIQKYAKFISVSLIALFFNLSFLYIFTEYFKMYYLLSEVLAIGIAWLINFYGSALLVFKKNNSL